jgi:biopolymer transport protein ExbB
LRNGLTAAVRPQSCWTRATRAIVFGGLVFLGACAAPDIGFAAEPPTLIQENAGAGGNGGVAPGQADSSAPQLTMLEWLFDALGWLYTIVFLILSFVFVALVIMNVLSARQTQICPPELIEGFEARLDEKKYQEAYELAKADESFLGNVLSAGLGKLNAGYDHAIEAMQEVGEEENMKLEHRLSYIALIGSISPMVGLFGTVDGMIRSFWVIATSQASPEPSLLAKGVSTALLTTLIGLAIAIPAVSIYNILRNRVQRLVLEVGITSENLMSRFENMGKKT